MRTAASSPRFNKFGLSDTHLVNAYYGHRYESREFNVRERMPSVWQVILKGRIHYTKADGNRAVAEIDNDEHIVPLWGLATLASIRVLLRTPYLTEYILPLIIWLLPVGCWLLWESIRSHLV